MKRAIKYFIVFGIMATSGLFVSGQITNPLYFMSNVPQSNRINPAYQPNCGFYLGMPFLAPMKLQFSSSSLGVNDLIFPSKAVNDSLITPFHPLADSTVKDAFLSNLRSSKNNLTTDIGLTMFSLGKRIKKSFISLDAVMRTEFAYNYSGGLFQFAMNGINNADNSIDLSGAGFDFTIYTETGVGFSRKDFILPNLDIGIRGKVMFGMANVSTRESELEIVSSMDSLYLHLNMEVAASTVPILVDLSNYEPDLENLEPPPLGIEDMQFGSIDQIKQSASEIFGGILKSNVGFGLDVGASYRPIPQLQVSASLIDLGYIKWNNNASAKLNFDYNFQGVEISSEEIQKIIDNGTEEIFTSIAEELIDSLISPKTIDIGAAPSYRSMMTPKLFVGASFYPIQKIGFGLLSRTDFLKDHVSQQFTGSVNMTTGRHINLTLSYSYMQRKFNNIGAGISLVARPFNLYLISDNIISAGYRLLEPENIYLMEARSINLWFGMNITFGWKKSAKKAKTFDRPLIL